MTTRYADHVIGGDHASRPAATAVPEGTTYSCTDHGLEYQSDGATWSTRSTFGTAGGYAPGGTDVAVADGGTGASTAAGAATNLGLGTGDSPQFTAVNIGHASDTTVTRTGAGDIAVEGNAVYRAGGTDVPVTDGGTGASTASAARGNLGALADTDAITYLDGTVAAAPSTPAAGKLRIYAKTGKVLAVKDDAGLETVLGQGIADQGTVANYLDYTEIAAPSTPSSGKVRLYAKSDGLLYSKDDAGTETAVTGGGGGGGAGWTKVIDEAGGSVANWTVRDGTWGTSGGVIQQTNAGAAEYHMQYTAALYPLAMCVVQAELWIPSANSTDDYIGLDIGMNTANTANGGLRVYLKRSGTSLIVGTFQGGAETGAPTVTVNTDTWYTVKAFVAGSRVSVWLDGTFKFTRDTVPSAVVDGSYFGLFTALSTGQFRNIQLWTLDLPI